MLPSGAFLGRSAIEWDVQNEEQYNTSRLLRLVQYGVYESCNICGIIVESYSLQCVMYYHIVSLPVLLVT